jgi:hypothetical protein
MKKLAALTLSVFLSYGVAFADTPKDADPQPGKPAQPPKANAAKKAARYEKPDAGIASELEELRQALQSQQEQLQMLKEELAKRDRQIEEAREAAAAANAHAAEASSKAVEAVNASAEVKSTATSLKLTVADLKARNEALKSTVASEHAVAEGASAARPANQEHKSDSIELANGKVRIGTQLFADYAYYTKTGFGPQFLTQVNQPGPANNSYNTFEISRAYINLFYSPNDAVTFRLTPNLYRQIGAAPATKVGKAGAIGANTDQELSYRIKYAYVDFNTLFAGSEAFKKDKLTIGTQQNPLVDWEENLYGYRWTSLVPWNYLSLSSAQTGVKLQGPIEFNGKQYVDYSIGVFTNASFRQLEQSEKKQAMARLTVYPFGAKSNFDGLGFTGFYNYGYRNVTPDSPTFPLYRVAALAHYTFKKNAYGIAGEFDLGRNAFNSGNFFSGSGPQDEFGVAPTGGTQFATWDKLVQALQNGNGTKQRGYAAFGHAQIPNTPFTLFAMYHYFLPNTQVDKNPLDFHRIIGGISYKVNDRLRFGLTSQNLVFRHSQFTFPASELALFSPSLAAANPNGIPNAVPNRVQAIFANVELNF